MLVRASTPTGSHWFLQVKTGLSACELEGVSETAGVGGSQRISSSRRGSRAVHAKSSLAEEPRTKPRPNVPLLT